MKHDTRQFISITQHAVKQLGIDDDNTYRHCVHDASKILQTLTSENFEIYSIWIYIGKLFLYALSDAKKQGISSRELNYYIVSLSTHEQDKFCIEDAKFELEAFICDSIFKSKIVLPQLFDCFEKLGVTINQIKTFSLAILSINQQTQDAQYLKDTLSLALFDHKDLRPILITNVTDYMRHVKGLICKEKVKLYHDHYKLF